MTSLLEIAWLAGLIEGEGSFGWMPNSISHGGRALGGGSVFIQLAMTDRDTVEKAKRVFGSNVSTVICKPRHEGYKESYRFMVSGVKAAAWMMTLHPLLGNRRQTRVRELLTLWRAAPYRKPQGYARPATCHPERPYRSKGFCSPCAGRYYYKLRASVDTP